VKIAYISQWWPPEPATIVASLAGELARRGHGIEVVTGFPNYPSGVIYPGYSIRWRNVDGSPTFRTTRVPLYPSHDSSGARRALNYLSFGLAASTVGLVSVLRADVAYVYHPPLTSAWLARLLRRLRGVPFVLHVQDLWPDSVTNSGILGQTRISKLAVRALSRMALRTYRAASHIVVISPGFKSRLVSLGVSADKITVVLNWADEALFFPADVDPAARAELGPLGDRVVLYAGNLGRFQNLDMVIRAMAALTPDAGLHLAIMGDGLERSELERLVDEMQVSNVSFLHPRSAHDSVRIQAAADVHLVSLSDEEFCSLTIPGKTQVALAMGKPLLMAVRGDAAELVEQSCSGIVCLPELDALTSALQQVADMSEFELDRLGEQGRDFYVDHLSINRAGNQFESILSGSADR
jgi:colanic acid biosynthesis glycosyl transferase WcaI